MLPHDRRDQWLDTAVSGIRFGLDRKAVRKELEDHMEDKLAGLRRLFPDIPEEEAQDRVLRDMGDAQELKASLARVHRPWLGWLWNISRWAMLLALTVANLVQMTVRTDYSLDNSIWGRSAGTQIYGRIRDGEEVRVGQYTFQITGAACLDRPEAQGAEDSLQVALRVSSPKFWERISTDAVYGGLTAAGPDGEWRPMDRMSVIRYTVEDGAGGSTTYQQWWIGAELSRWGPCYREFAVRVPAEGWQPGDRVSLKFDSELGSFALSVPVTEKVRVQ